MMMTMAAVMIIMMMIMMMIVMMMMMVMTAMMSLVMMMIMGIPIAIQKQSSCYTDSKIINSWAIYLHMAIFFALYFINGTNVDEY